MSARLAPLFSLALLASPADAQVQRFTITGTILGANSLDYFSSVELGDSFKVVFDLDYSTVGIANPDSMLYMDAPNLVLLRIGDLVTAQPTVSSYAEIFDDNQQTAPWCADSTGYFMSPASDFDRIVVAGYVADTMACPNMHTSTALPSSIYGFPSTVGFASNFWIEAVDNLGGLVDGWIEREIIASAGSFSETCFGDGAAAMGCSACPCGNSAAGAFSGCLNSAGVGATLIGSGSTSVTAPDPTDLRFDLVGGVPGSFAVLLSGAAIAPQNPANPCFGMDTGVQSAVTDGLRCAVLSTQRHGVRAVDASGFVGITTNGWGGEDGPPTGLAALSGFGAGTTRHFQAFYREVPGAVCLTGQNTTQAVSVTFAP